MNNNDAFPIEKFTSKSGHILRNIPEEIRIQLDHHMVDRTYRKGQNIFLEGSFPAGIFILKEGMVKKYKTDHYGKEHIISVCVSDEMLGYSALLCNEPYPDSAAAIETSVLGFISREFFMESLISSNALMMNLLSSLSHEFGVMVNSINVFAQMTVRERVALILLVLTEKFRRKPGNEPVEIVLSRDDMASMAGTATETLVRLLQEMKKEGIIEINVRAITVKKFKELIVISKFF
ncbi:MAG: Crp/Fnr family transcriptional regulator [Bacteroidota bacterium]